MNEIASIEERMFEIVSRSQAALLEAARKSTDSVVAAVGSNPDGIDELGRLVDGVFDLTEKLLAGQREFARGVVQAVTDALGAHREEGATATRHERAPRARPRAGTGVAKPRTARAPKSRAEAVDA